MTLRKRAFRRPRSPAVPALLWVSEAVHLGRSKTPSFARSWAVLPSEGHFRRNDSYWRMAKKLPFTRKRIKMNPVGIPHTKEGFGPVGIPHAKEGFGQAVHQKKLNSSAFENW